MSKPRDERQKDLFRPALDQIFDLKHPKEKVAGIGTMRALARRAKGAFDIGVCSMIALTCSIGLGQATPDEQIPEPQSWLTLATGFVLMVVVARVLKRHSRGVAGDRRALLLPRRRRCRAAGEFGYPKTIRLDNGRKFISKELDLWAFIHNVTLDFSRPGKLRSRNFQRPGG